MASRLHLVRWCPFRITSLQGLPELDIPLLVSQLPPILQILFHVPRVVKRFQDGRRCLSCSGNLTQNCH
ncbi:hypothetical protein J4Q44_G00129730 [Coregonus suidteri]|uniref:Uncharacterized protein n=1 Tax=Coregonus suidteri TaxID=861788 RepID=A0AAN8LV26_9TELE